MRRTKHISSIQPEIVTDRVQVKKDKLRDVDSLLKKHYGENWRNLQSLEYYKKVLSEDVQENSAEVQGNREDLNNIEEYLMNEVLDFVQDMFRNRYIINK